MGKFYIIILIELVFYPFLFLFEELKKINGKLIKENNDLINKDFSIIDNEILFVVHEWAGYPFIRSKKIKYVNKEFTCGLKFHLQRWQNYQGKFKLKKIITVSDCNKKYVEDLTQSDFFSNDIEIIPVDNTSMDFSGYSYVCKNRLDKNKNQIVFLTNTSVDFKDVTFIDEYSSLFEKDPSLGLLGISYSSKIYQTLIKNNFNLHLQSFFLVTRTSVLLSIIEKNGGYFPGSEHTYKLGIIRFGESKISKIAQKLGYNVKVVLEDGALHTFPNSGLFYNGYFKWKLPFGDYRLHCVNPNRINKLKF
jgi:hypothetical protein